MILRIFIDKVKTHILNYFSIFCLINSYIKLNKPFKDGKKTQKRWGKTQKDREKLKKMKRL